MNITEKPKKPKSNIVITGLYFFDKNVIKFSKQLKPSKRKELEITDIIKKYLKSKKLTFQNIGRGTAWLDTGTQKSLLEASQFIETIENRQGLKVACPEEIAFRQGWIDSSQLKKLIMPNEYGIYLSQLLSSHN